MEKTKKALKLHRTAFERIYKTVEDSFTTNRCDLLEIQSSIRVLDEEMSHISELNQLMLDLILDSEEGEDSVNEELEIMNNLSCQYHRIKFRFENFLLEGHGTKKTGCKNKLKVPKLEFRQYGGDLKEWLGFWNQFSRIDADSDIEEEDKLQYLLQAMTPGSRARQIVESYPATKGNYEKAIHSLKQRFGREDLLIEVYVRELLKLVLTNLNSNNKLSSFFDKIESQLRALESLGVKSDTCAAMLYPLVESCLAEDLIRAWHRSQLYFADASLKKRLDALMDFLRQEVMNEDRIAIALNTFKEKRKPEERNTNKDTNIISTASELFSKSMPRCAFCNKAHFTSQCEEALALSFAERKQRLSDAACCYLCTKFGHVARRCRLSVKCDICKGRHCTLMCPKEDTLLHKTTENDTSTSNEQNLTNYTFTEIFLQTMVVELRSDKKSQKVRLLIDTGSHKSYISRKIAQEIGYQPIREEELVHSLFGGAQTETVKHTCYKVRIYSLTENYSCNFEVLDQPLICSHVSSVRKGPWLDELWQMGVKLTDTTDGPIDVLVGADIAGKLLSGRKYELSCGLVAIHTLLGWTVMGKLKAHDQRTSSMFISSLFSRDVGISDLWSLDVLGIEDPERIKTSREQEHIVMAHFLNTVKQNDDKRYEVNMPWIQGHPPLPPNFYLAKKRLGTVITKLQKDNFYQIYNEIFENWLNEGVIECSDEDSLEISSELGHFLPHHPVYKPNSCTTPIRPVFDASSRERGQPSLNQCLEKGVNLIRVIPSMLLQFRTEKIGVIADIKKAFLQIGLNSRDRNFLKFLWYDKDGIMKVFRHARVVFGVTCSPFLLGAVLEHHLREIQKKSSCKENEYSSDIISKLRKSFYVDNVITSVKDEEALYHFVEQSTQILADGCFELRGWEHTLSGNSEGETNANVLGLIWNNRLDTLELSLEGFDKMDVRTVTKRNILSAAHKLFDPIGFSSPVTLVPKLLLQKIWPMNLGWDTEITGEVGNKFLNWLQELPMLATIKLPRWLSNFTEYGSQTVHVFCDASCNAYATCIFLRTELGESVEVKLVEAKSRVASKKGLTIPRLELLAATIGVRMLQNFKANHQTQFKVYMWSDSSTVLSWIKRKDHWKPFIWNRVQEIRSLSQSEEWNYVPGNMNPADLPSRGCSAKVLAAERWWEGPKWLYCSISQWPKQKFDCDEQQINQERCKTIISSFSVTKGDYTWYYKYFSKFSKIVKLIGWVKRFISALRQRNLKKGPTLTADELEVARITVIQLIQEEVFKYADDPKLSSLCPFLDDKGLIRIHTKISDRKDAIDFCMPYVLPSNHEVVKRLILEEHIKQNHIGVQSLMRILRENYWILKCRRTIRTVINQCITCRRFRGKVLQPPSICLPEARVRDAAVFEVLGIDLAGPLYLKSKEKVWIVLFTCAVYRAVHLELASSLSSMGFLQAFRRFIARRGRPSIIYTDCGTNFMGAENAFQDLDWTEVAKESSTLHRIDWRFNPPTAAWWGGWWERLIRITKEVMRKVLGRACLNFEELQTILCDCEAILNARPLTYMSEDSNDCIALTPAMFLQDIKEVGVADIDLVEATDLTRHYRHRIKLRNDLNRRFKSEYLGQLTLFSKKMSKEQVKVGDIVLIADFNKKKFDWVMGRVMEAIPGRDGAIRIVRVKTAIGELVRPVQHICLLEMNSSKEQSVTAVLRRKKDEKPRYHVEAKGHLVTTRCGREVKVPSRYKE